MTRQPSNSQALPGVTDLLAVLACVLLLTAEMAQAQSSPRARAIEFWDDATPGSRLTPNHSEWQRILDAYLVDDHPSAVNRFKYRAVTTDDEAALIDYLSYLQLLDPRQMNKDTQKAYWLNLYNATLVAYIISSEPSVSIRGLNRGDFWRLTRFNIASQDLSFDDIEHGILRPIFKDARIHFALFRGAVGWANLSKEAYSGERVEQQLDEATRAFLTHPRAVEVEGEELRLSRLFKWKQDDFGDGNDGIKRYIQRYVEPERADRIQRATRVRYQFDWSLNAVE